MIQITLPFSKPPKKLITRLVARYLVKLGSTSWKKASGIRMEFQSFIQVWKDEFCWCVVRLFGHKFFVLGCSFWKNFRFLQCTVLPRRDEGSSKLEKTNHTLFCCCRLACWKCSPFKVSPDRLWNCWLRATVWYIVMQLGALSGCYLFLHFCWWAFWGQVFLFATCHIYFLGHTRCESMKYILIEKVFVTALLFLSWSVVPLKNHLHSSSPSRLSLHVAKQGNGLRFGAEGG